MGRPRGQIKELEQRRYLAVDLVQKGIPAVDVASRFKIHERTIHKWLQTYRKEGLEGLQVKVSTGRKKKLTNKDQAKLQRIIVAGAVKAGFPNEIWTSKRVLSVIKDQFDVEYHANHLPKLLRGLGFTPQRPQREAIEKDRKQIESWIRFEWKRIKKKARKTKATVVFIDESGILMSLIVKRTWAKVGQTPKISHRTRSHTKVTAIGAIAIRYNGRRARTMFRLLKARNANSVVFVQFLTQLLQNIRGKIIVIWDRLVAQSSKLVGRWLRRNKRIETEFLLPYAPELNPVEYLWSYLKMNGLANLAATDLEHLYRETKSSLCSIRKNRNLSRSFVDHSPANFFN